MAFILSIGATHSDATVWNWKVKWSSAVSRNVNRSTGIQFSPDNRHSNDSIQCVRIYVKENSTRIRDSVSFIWVKRMTQSPVWNHFESRAKNYAISIEMHVFWTGKYPIRWCCFWCDTVQCSGNEQANKWARYFFIWFVMLHMTFEIMIKNIVIFGDSIS